MRLMAAALLGAGIAFLSAGNGPAALGCAVVALACLAFR